MQITLEVTTKEYEFYIKYCELFETNPVTDLTEYLQARSNEMEEYLMKQNK